MRTNGHHPPADCAAEARRELAKRRVTRPTPSGGTWRFSWMGSGVTRRRDGRRGARRTSRGIRWSRRTRWVAAWGPCEHSGRRGRSDLAEQPRRSLPATSLRQYANSPTDARPTRRLPFPVGFLRATSLLPWWRGPAGFDDASRMLGRLDAIGLCPGDFLFEREAQQSPFQHSSALRQPHGRSWQGNGRLRSLTLPDEAAGKGNPNVTNRWLTSVSAATARRSRVPLFFRPECHMAEVGRSEPVTATQPSEF